MEKKYEKLQEANYPTAKEKKRAIETQRKLSKQDDAMWDKNEGISQLEGRIETNNFQG